MNHSANPIVLLIWAVSWQIIVAQLLVWKRQPGEGQPSSGRSSDQLSPGHDPAPCPACQAQLANQQQEVRPLQPPRLARRRGRPVEVDTSSNYCPNRACAYFGWVGLGNLRSNGHPNGGRWRQLECLVCHKCFMETSHTIFYAKKAPAETIWRVLKALTEGLDIRATARVFDLDPNTVQTWLKQAAEHMQAVEAYLLHDLHLTQVQVDELWALLGRRENPGEGQPKQRSKRWVWAAVDPVSKLWLSHMVGDRSLACAQRLIHAVAQMLAQGCLPVFLSDQWSAYWEALVTHFGQWVATPRRYQRGRSPKPRWEALPGLHYAQLVKERFHGRVVRVSFRMVCGQLDQVLECIKASGVGQVVNTALIERLNLSIRQHVSALRRRTLSVAKTEAGLQTQLNLFKGYYNFCLPHASLRLPLSTPKATKGTGSPKQWQARTPAMAAGLVSRPYRLEEMLFWRVPPRR